jgi:hypothetical protein
VTLLAAVLVSVGAAYEAFAHGVQADVPVTSTLNDAGDVIAGTNYQVQNDGSLSYFNGVASVSSIIQGSSGDWVLDTTTSRTRTILIDLRQAIPGSGAAPPFAYELLPVRIITKCSEARTGGFPAMTLDETLSCPTGISFQYGGNQYGLMMASGPNSDVNYAETSNPQVTCTSVSGSKCNKWTVLPIQQADGTIRNIGRLRKPIKGKIPFAFLGDYYVSFNIEVTNP